MTQQTPLKEQIEYRQGPRAATVRCSDAKGSVHLSGFKDLVEKIMDLAPGGGSAESKKDETRLFVGKIRSRLLKEMVLRLGRPGIEVEALKQFITGPMEMDVESFDGKHHIMGVLAETVIKAATNNTSEGGVAGARIDRPIAGINDFIWRKSTTFSVNLDQEIITVSDTFVEFKLTKSGRRAAKIGEFNDLDDEAVAPKYFSIYMVDEKAAEWAGSQTALISSYIENNALCRISPSQVSVMVEGRGGTHNRQRVAEEDEIAESIRRAISARVQIFCEKFSRKSTGIVVLTR